MHPHMDDPFGFEQGPEPTGEQNLVSRLIEGYHALGQVETQTFDTISDDLISRVASGEITEDQAKQVLAGLGFEGFDQAN